MPAILPQSFFNRPVRQVARDLIGHSLVRQLPDGTIIRRMITETEAYDGEQDKACHACRGRTKRNSVMYGPAGHWYVYFVYGMHWMLNIVTGEEGYPAAVLIRGVEGTVGPARLTKLLGVDGRLNGQISGRMSMKISGHSKLSKSKLGQKKIVPTAGNLWIEYGARKAEIEKGKVRKIKATARIGVDYAGPIWSKKKYRFVLE